MLDTVKALTTEYDMLPRGGRVLCAVSGGADSICLLHLIHCLSADGDFQVYAAHYHHGMRGADADADAAFVEAFCRERNIPCVVERGDVYGEARRRGLGVEETGRLLRYEFLHRTAERLGCNRIATAHNADDNLETLLLHLTRGAGLHGLAGIAIVLQHGNTAIKKLNAEHIVMRMPRDAVVLEKSSMRLSAAPARMMESPKPPNSSPGTVFSGTGFVIQY